ncbi:winged helix-turn-helix domain-containing protein [Streptomyces sp. NPDC051366]|uniref:winged helix-turn-helix domain-containing protein n=1 Tax=Streptomyces sp. NPDC051366 TaxID=3365652 RepID=UPI0037905358
MIARPVCPVNGGRPVSKAKRKLPRAYKASRKFHVSYSVSGATRPMHRRGFSPQVPARRYSAGRPHGPPRTGSRSEQRGHSKIKATRY